MKEEQNILGPFSFDEKKNWAEQFFRFDIRAFEKLLREKGEAFWLREGERRALNIFHAAAERVPAYKDFLKRHKIRHERVTTIQEFQNVPVTDKKNYVQAYPLEERCWEGDLSTSNLVAVSSGTTGEPTFWPRGGFQDFEAAVVHELLYRFHFSIDKCSTLLVIGFPVGMYVSGVATLQPSSLVAAKGYNLTIASVGNNKNDILRVVQHLHKHYDQIILVGHPLFMKDVIETGKRMGIAWGKKRLHTMFCSQGFSEEWRRYILEGAGVPFTLDTAISTYGSSEFLLMAYETPLSIFTRTMAGKDKLLAKEFFGDAPLPDLFQYNPFIRYIETQNDNFLFTAASGVPLIRFNLHDGGKIIPFSQMRQILDAKLPDWKNIFSKEEDGGRIWQLPFLALSGRSDYTVVFYAVNIYPDHIRQALETKVFFNKFSGKFVMRKGYRKNMDEFLEIAIELGQDVTPPEGFAHVVRDAIVNHLKKVNMEYNDAARHVAKDLRPRIKLVPYQDPKYFKPGVKPRYIAAG